MNLLTSFLVWGSGYALTLFTANLVGLIIGFGLVSGCGWGRVGFGAVVVVISGLGVIINLVIGWVLAHGLFGVGYHYFFISIWVFPKTLVSYLIF